MIYHPKKVQGSSAPKWLIELNDIAKAATPGPWTYSGCEDPQGDKYQREGHVNGPSCLPIPDTVAYEPRDAAFIAAANPQTVLWLLQELEWFRSHTPDWRQNEEHRIRYDAGPGGTP